MKKVLILFSALLMLALLTLAVGAADVVYLKSGGTGDGSSDASPVGSINDAFKKLDLSGDCTIVLCGEFSQTTAFVYTKQYSGTVTITSVYNGVDYRETAGAVYSIGPNRYVMTGATVFENMNFYLQDAYCLVIAQHHPLTIGEGVSIESASSKCTGKGITSSFSILGGYQNGQPISHNNILPPTISDEPVNVTVKSGSKILIVAYSRQIQMPAYSGKATITVEGDAQVGVIYYTPVNASFFGNADVEINLRDNASIGKINGNTNGEGTINSLTINWEGGEIGGFSKGAGEGTTATSGYILNYSAAAGQSALFPAISTHFDKVNAMDTPAAAPTVVKLTIGKMTGYINDEAKALDAAPIIRNSRTMLPVRFVAEAFGAEVGWDGTTSTVTVKTADTTIEIVIGKATAKVNGKEITLDSPAFIESSRTYLPVRFVAENLGAEVAWDGATSTATLTK